LRLLDQTRLPHEEVYLELTSYREVVSAITEMKVRGAPAIGVAGAYGIALGALGLQAGSKEEFRTKLKEVILAIAGTRPTARNLFMAIERMQRVADVNTDPERTIAALVSEAVSIHAEEAEASRKMARFGAELIEDGFTVLTHCNTGPLAAPGYGTALGVIKYAWEQGKKLRVFADESRPRLQGARLTAWELKQANIPFTLITDSMAGYFISRGEIDCAIVGADRIAANGDAANKIGTYTVAVLAKEHGIPFYIAAPTTTVDLKIASGKEIPIEERDPAEVTRIDGVNIAPDSTIAANPAFDVTPHRYITAIITERGIIKEPYVEGLKKVIL
jgi:methylthioribose-1-phosphate isomerase